MSTMKVPMNEDRAQVMGWIEKMVTPMARANPNIIAFYVLTHYYGADSRDMVLVRVYKDLAAIEAPCGEPCDECTGKRIRFPRRALPSVRK